MALFDLPLFGVVIGFDLISILLAAAVPLLLYLCFRRPSGLPPFPVTPIPILGNLLSLEKDPRSQFGLWRKTHGEIFSLYLGPKLAIVLNGFTIMREALVKNGEVFSDRPDIAMFKLILGGKGIVSTSGPQWKSLRKYSLTALREFGFGRNSLEAEILQEVQHVLELFASKKGEKYDYSHIYNISTSNVICLTLFGHRFQFEDENFVACCNALNDAIKSISNTSLLNFFPFLAKIPGSMRTAKFVIEKVAYFEEHLIKAEIKTHYDVYDGTTPDFVAAYIKEIKDRESAGLDVSYLKDNFTEIMRDLFIAGTETTATTLKWMILFLIHFPEVQEKCFLEIRDNIGFERFPTLQDKPTLSYLEAMIAETQRRSNIAPLGILHATSEETKFHGHTIPKGALVILNMDSVLMDPDVWPEPEEFRPERFMDKSGAFFKPESFIPFSTGRRVCLGEALAKIELFLFSLYIFASFIHLYFSFLIIKDSAIWLNPYCYWCFLFFLFHRFCVKETLQADSRFSGIDLQSFWAQSDEPLKEQFES